MKIMEPLIETWKIHNRINLYLLESITEVHLTDQSASKGRNVGAQFAHSHDEQTAIAVGVLELG